MGKEWVLQRGKLAAARGTIVLDPDGGRDAEAWLAGSESWRCLRGEVSLEARPDAQAWVYLRARPGTSFLRIGWSGQRIEVQVKGNENLVRQR